MRPSTPTSCKRSARSDRGLELLGEAGELGPDPPPKRERLARAAFGQDPHGLHQRGSCPKLRQAPTAPRRRGVETLSIKQQEGTTEGPTETTRSTWCTPRPTPDESPQTPSSINGLTTGAATTSQPCQHAAGGRVVPGLPGTRGGCRTASWSWDPPGARSPALRGAAPELDAAAGDADSGARIRTTSLWAAFAPDFRSAD